MSPAELITAIVVVAVLIAWLGWLWLRRQPVRSPPLVPADLVGLLTHVSSPNGAGDLGEKTLTRCLDALGYTDYELQKRVVPDWLNNGGGVVDCLLTISDGLQVVLDSKMSGMKELIAELLGGEGNTDETAAAIAKKVGSQIKQLGLKQYASNERNTFPRVLMFIPNDVVYAAVQRADPRLLAQAEQNDIVLVCPGTLAGALSAIKVADSARRDATAADVHHAATVIGKSVVRLHTQLGKTFSHFDALARDYDELAKRVNKEMLPSLRHLDELGVEVKKLDELSGPRHVGHASLVLAEVSEEGAS